MSVTTRLLAQRDQAQATVAALLNDARGAAEVKVVCAQMLDEFTAVVLGFEGTPPEALLQTLVELNRLIADGLRESATTGDDDGVS